MALRDALRAKKLVQLYEYWESKRRGRRFPGRKDIDPLEMGFILGNLDIVEISGDPPVFRFRLCGSMIDDHEGFTVRGKTLDEYPNPEVRENLRTAYISTYSTGMPHYEEINREKKGKITRFARLILPLARDGSTIDMLLVGRVPLDLSLDPPLDPTEGSPSA